MASTKTSTYLDGHEYDLGNGTKGIWSDAVRKGKGGFVDEETYRSMRRGQGQHAGFPDMMSTMRRIEEAKELSKKFAATGFLGNLTRDDGEGAYRGIGGTPGFNLEEKVLPLRANAFLKAAMETRNPITGGSAVPNPTNIEGKKLESRDASLNIGQSGEQLRAELDLYRQALVRRQKGLSAENPFDLRTDRAEDIPQGAFFIGTNGKLYRNQKGAGAPGQTAQERASSFEYLGPEGR
jgi:hypothetical protein